MNVRSLKDVSGGGEDQLHVRNCTCTPGNGISHVHALGWYRKFLLWTVQVFKLFSWQGM